MLQYVGARYTPNFTGEEWESTKEYEALTVVGYQGNSYISRKPVPVGILIGNAEYWVLYGTGGSGGNDPRVPAIIEDVNQLKTDVSGLESAVADKAEQSSLDTLSGTVSNLSNTVASKQDMLVSGVNIKTINGQPLTGSGNIDVGGGGSTIVLEPTTGQSTTNGMTQKAITDALSSKADATTVATLESTVANKADQSALDTLSGTVSSLTTTVNGKANQSSLDALSTTVSTKADKSALDNSHTQFLKSFAVADFVLVDSGNWFGWYKATKTGVTIYNPSGSVRASGDALDKPSSDVNRGIVSGMCFEIDTTANELNAYAKSAPTETVYVAVEGVN